MIHIENKKELCKKLGYGNLEPCLKKLEFLEKEGIERFLQEKFDYDFTLGKEIFLKKVIELCGNEEDMKRFEKERERLGRRPGHLFVYTGFKRDSQSIFVLAFLEGKRNFGIDRKDFKDKKEELAFVKEFVKKHYKKTEGKLPVWGKIKYYVYKSDWFDNYIVLDPEGKVVKELKEFHPAIATLSLK